MKIIVVKQNKMSELRMKMGFSMRVLAVKAKLNPVTICNIENAKSNANPKTAKIICEVLSVDFDDLFEIKDSPKEVS